MSSTKRPFMNLDDRRKADQVIVNCTQSEDILVDVVYELFALRSGIEDMKHRVAAAQEIILTDTPGAARMLFEIITESA